MWMQFRVTPFVMGVTLNCCNSINGDIVCDCVTSQVDECKQKLKQSQSAERSKAAAAADSQENGAEELSVLKV